MAFEDLTLQSFIWEITLRATPPVAPNLPPPPEERRPVRGIKPLERSKYHRRLGTPPRRDAGCGSQWRFPRFRACARPRILGGDDVWRIDGLLTLKLYRNGCIKQSALKSAVPTVLHPCHNYTVQAPYQMVTFAPR